MSEPQSSLTEIPAVGSTRLKRLRKEGFTTTSGIADATADELADVPAVSLNVTSSPR